MWLVCRYGSKGVLFGAYSLHDIKPSQLKFERKDGLWRIEKLFFLSLQKMHGGF